MKTQKVDCREHDHRPSSIRGIEAPSDWSIEWTGVRLLAIMRLEPHVLPAELRRASVAAIAGQLGIRLGRREPTHALVPTSIPMVAGCPAVGGVAAPIADSLTVLEVDGARVAFLWKLRGALKPPLPPGRRLTDDERRRFDRALATHVAETHRCFQPGHLIWIDGDSCRRFWHDAEWRHPLLFAGTSDGGKTWSALLGTSRPTQLPHVALHPRHMLAGSSVFRFDGPKVTFFKLGQRRTVPADVLRMSALGPGPAVVPADRERLLAAIVGAS